MRRVGIVGLGLIGGSAGMALTRAIPGLEVMGIARRQETADEAVRLGAAHRAGTDLSMLRGCDLVLLACPLGSAARVLEECIPHLDEGARVTDVGSVKAPIVAHALGVLDSSRNRFLGGHPMAGKELTGIANADAGLFRGRVWALTPPHGWFSSPGSALASERAGRQGGYELEGWQDFTGALRAIGALPLFVPPDRHDRYVALVSHLPFLLSAAYLRAVGEDEAFGEAAELASSGFRDFSRLGAGDPGMYAAIASMNREELRRGIASVRAALEAFAAAVESDEGSRAFFEAAKGIRDAWASGHPGLT